MSLADIGRDDVLAAIAEFDDLGRTQFLAKYGFGPARQYVVLHKGQEYDSKALVGAAHRFATGRALPAREFSGGVQTVVARLTALGFDFRDLKVLPSDAELRRFGELPGFPEGTTFRDRRGASDSGVHRALQAGIVGTGKLGAESIVSSGGYEDDDDQGSMIIYTGHGGRDANGRQVSDQSFASPGNAALQTSAITGTPVRVVRGPDPQSPHAPITGYRYDGLFRVEDASRVPGQGSFQVCRFQMVKVTEVDLAYPSGDFQVSDQLQHAPVPVGDEQPGRRLATTQRIVRKTNVIDYVKQLHDHTCQMCGTRLALGNQAYSEGAHIRALGGLHRGPDVAANVLCLCPNCHVQFDRGALIIQQDYSLTRNGDSIGTLRTHSLHPLGDAFITHHREAHS